MDIKLIAFDLDGTILDDAKKIPPENITALKAAHDRGIIIVPASGRLYPYIPAEVRELPFVRYCITANGGCVYDAETGKNLYSAEIPLDVTLRIFDYLDGVDCLYDCYADSLAYADVPFFERADAYFLDPVMNAMLHSYIVKTRDIVPDLREFVVSRGGPIQKMQSYFADDALRMAELKRVSEKFPELAVSTSLANNLEINSKDATKGKALTMLCERLGIPVEASMAIGDGTNDLTMVQAAGVGVCMANGHDTVKAAADYIAPDNNSAGLAETIRHYGIY